MLVRSQNRAGFVGLAALIYDRRRPDFAVDHRWRSKRAWFRTERYWNVPMCMPRVNQWTNHPHPGSGGRTETSAHPRTRPSLGVGAICIRWAWHGTRAEAAQRFRSSTGYTTQQCLALVRAASYVSTSQRVACTSWRRGATRARQARSGHGGRHMTWPVATARPSARARLLLQ